nr:hypothetical protein [Tanacetum cinerariifolium]
MCMAYGCEPFVDLFREFYNLCRAVFYVQDSIILAKYSQLVSVQNKLDSKSFKDKLPPNIKENLMFKRLGQYPTSVHVFPDYILFLAGLKPSWEHGQQQPAIMAGDEEMDFRNFIYVKDVEDLSFLPKEPSPGFNTGSPSISVNTKPLKPDEELMLQLVEVMTDSKESLKPPVKRKLAHGSSISHATRAKTYSLKDDVPYLIVSDDDEGLLNVLELKDAISCHLKISTISPSAWKNHLDNHMDVELLDLYVIKKLRGEFDVMKDREKASKEECEELQAKCVAAMIEFEKNPTVVALQEKISTLSTEVKEHKASKEECEELQAKCVAAMIEFEKNPTVVALQEKISTLSTEVKEHKAEMARLKAVEVSHQKEVEELKHDRRDVVSKVIPYVAMKLVHNDHMGSLVGRLVSSAILYGRCRAYEHVADMKEPFDLSKLKGYRSSYKKDHTQASNDHATATFPWLDEFVGDPSALIEALLSKKPSSL